MKILSGVVPTLEIFARCVSDDGVADETPGRRYWCGLRHAAWR